MLCSLYSYRSIVCFRYFEEEDEQQHSKLEYIPAPDSPTNNKSDCDSDSSEDPLDAFMEGLEKEVQAHFSFLFFTRKLLFLCLHLHLKFILKFLYIFYE